MAANFKRAKARAQGAGEAGRAGWAGGAGRAALNYHQAPLGSRPSVEPSADERAKAEALLDKVIAAKGGLEKLRALKTIVVKQTLTTQTPQGDATAETSNHRYSPCCCRMRMVRKKRSPSRLASSDSTLVTSSSGWTHERKEPSSASETSAG